MGRHADWIGDRKIAPLPDASIRRVNEMPDDPALQAVVVEATSMSPALVERLTTMTQWAM